jgi:drug/metabolite transporter (DMT)-like permease
MSSSMLVPPLRTRPSRLAPTRRTGIALALTTACISGVAVFVNGYGVRHFPDATTYTTAKNLVAAVLLGALLVGASAAGSAEGFTRPRGSRAWIGVAAVAVVGGSIPFVLFFEGLARSTSTDAAFLHKTLVVWVALAAVPLLRERIGFAHVLAIALLVGGQVVIAGDLAGLRLGAGETMVLAATLLWAAEVVLAKRLLAGLSALTVGTARMAGGVVVLLAWAATRGELASLWALDAAAWGWALLTGSLLFAYVATWYSALARAQAVDVTAVLVFGAVVTALLARGVEGVALPQPTGLGLLAAGTLVVLLAASRRGTAATGAR